jgi:hypothetical protein
MNRWKGATMKKLFGTCLLAVAVLATGGCESRTDEADGGVILSITDFDGVPTVVSVNAVTGGNAGQVSFDSLEVSSFLANPGGGTSDLMTVEIDAYEVTYVRVDEGTRTPPPLVRAIGGVVPPGGTVTYDNLPVLGTPQLLNPPLSDLLFVNGGFDKETGERNIILNVKIRFFGETISGRDVASNTMSFTIEFVP